MPNLLKKSMEVVFDKKQKPSMFLTNMFKTKMLTGVKVEIQSRTVKSLYSVDVQIGTGARSIDMSKYKKKDYVVPEYNDLSTITEVDMLEAQFGETEYEGKIAKAADLITDRQEIISDMQRRSEEKQASDGLFYGKVTLANGDVIEYNKKSTHTIDLVSKKFTSASSNPVDIISDACDLCCRDAKMSVGVFNFIGEEKGVRALIANENFRNNSNAQAGINRTNVGIPEELTPGATFHGQFACGSYLVNIWSYNERYEIPEGYGFANEGKEVGYIPQGCALLLPVNPNFRRYYGAVNSVDAATGANVAGAKLNLQQKEQLPYAYDVVDNGSAVTKAGVKSRPLLVPVDIDCFATFKNMV